MLDVQLKAHPQRNEAQENEWFFEGVEKLLEIWFARDAGVECTLRSIPRAQLDGLMTIARCEIISQTSNELLDSYVLSESSMFITDTRIILKTCGTTRLLETVPYILELAAGLGLTTVANIFYSRKDFQRPLLQCDVHKDFASETKFLDKYFGDGSAFRVGDVHHDRWYLYTLPDPRLRLGRPDQTLEIMMHDLDERVMRVFTTAVSKDGQMATKLAGIDKLLPDGTVVDAKQFEPCGYSMNGLVEHTDHYVTIHVTPEPDFSYVSFETNQDQRCLLDQTQRVLRCFRPGRFVLTMFANRQSTQAQGVQKQLWDAKLTGYKRNNLHFLLLPEHTLVYAHFTKEDK